MDSLINYCLTNKIKVAKYELTEYWLDIGRIGDYEKAQEEIKDKF
jgi:NDP-sugar pyrophosphorylase family protein